MSIERINLLSTRRPTRVDDLYKAVPKPAGGVPKHGLPIWSDLLLDAKLPVIKAPKGALVFSRGKVGEKLWRRPAAQDFNLYDPNGYEVTYHYDALHDGNLRRLLAQEGLQRRLKELGLMTDNGEAVCSLKQLNEYRRYLKRLHLDSLNQERQHRDELERERQILENAQKYADKERMMLDKNALRKEKMDNNRAKIEEERLQKEHIPTASQHNLESPGIEPVTSDLNSHHQTTETLTQLAARRRRHAQRIKQITRRKLEDALRRRERSMALDQKEAERWQQKLEEQLDYKKRREELLIKHKQQMEFLVDMRNHVVKQQRLQLELALQDIKHRRNKQNRDKNFRQKSIAMMNAMSKAWDGHSNNVREVSKADVRSTLASTINIMKNKGQGTKKHMSPSRLRRDKDRAYSFRGDQDGTVGKGEGVKEKLSGGTKKGGVLKEPVEVMNEEKSTWKFWRRGASEKIREWQVEDQVTSSDHNLIRFEMRGKLEEEATEWNSRKYDMKRANCNICKESLVLPSVTVEGGNVDEIANNYQVKPMKPCAV
uniref:Fibrous sheath-interacting protein 2 n=1 Tax=Timema douglasi TaxID=61478 RepID=A0A7R8VKS0_TIMDO|nr:unnamed protein product [Timema douglasi]